MGYTIEDLMSSSQEKYEITFVAGQKGWANSISWILLIEDINALRNFKGRTWQLRQDSVLTKNQSFWHWSACWSSCVRPD